MLGVGLSLMSVAIRGRVADIPPAISITSGNGYAGSVYTSTRPGQWYAGGVVIPGQTGTTWTMTTALEGTAINQPGSNTIQMWTPDHIPGASRVGGGWWSPRRSVLVAGSSVTSIPDLWGVRDMVQATAASQPADAVIDGQRAVVWPDAASNVFVAPAAVFAPAYWLLVMRYRDGISAEMNGSGSALISGGGVIDDPRVALLTPNRLDPSGWSAAITRNAGSPETTGILPMPKALVEFSGTPVAREWGLGRYWGSLGGNRGWRGPIWEAVALGAMPDADLRARLQGFAAHMHGLAASLPADHPYKTNAPRIS